MVTNKIIQAGMGIGVSNWILANAVGSSGQIGVVSSTELDVVFVRRLQDGDPSGAVRRAMLHFPDQEWAAAVLKKYYIAEGKKPGTPYLSISMLTAKLSPERTKLVIIANFVEVFLAKEGHLGKIGINFLEKVQLPVLPSLYGAMLAGVDCVFMGAGIPREVPLVLDRLAQHEDVEYKLSVKGAAATDSYKLTFSPLKISNGQKPFLFRPKFYAIISSNVLALTLSKKATHPVDGFVIETATAGGHNAPPRGKLQLNERGEPIYGQRDEVDLKLIAELGLPFWLAGFRGSPEGLLDAVQKGAAGIQVGTAFALCNESGLEQILKTQIIALAISNQLDIFTDPLASPTGFPFKVARLEGTLSEQVVYDQRTRRCDLGYLREPYKKNDGTLGYRCASEPVDLYVKKGGTYEDTVGRKCLCNALMANIGIPQLSGSSKELPIVTLGADAKNIGQFLKNNSRSFSAKDVIAVVTGAQSAQVKSKS